MNIRGFGERDIELLSEVIDSGVLGSLEGPVTQRFEEEFAETMGTKYAVAMNCAMSVLHTAVVCAEAGAGCEVICDPVFVFGPLAVLYNNAVPKFVDIDPDTLTMDPDKLEAAITERTKAVIVTHAWGLPAKMDRIVEIAHKYDLIVVEDIAHAILGSYNGKYTGALGDIGSFSFQGSKQMSLGDGGMATTSREDLWRKMDLNAGAPTFHAVADGQHYNYRMNELTAAVGIAQLERLPGFIAKLTANATHYSKAVEGCKWLPLQTDPGAVNTYHLWCANFRGENHGISMDDFKRALGEAGAAGIWIGYTGMAAYQQPLFTNKQSYAFHCAENKGLMDYPDGLCPVAEKAIPRMVLAYTVQTEEQAEAEAERLHKAIDMLEG